MIYLIAQTYTNALAVNLEIIFENKPLKQIQLRKSAEKELFIAKITKNDYEMDISLAKKFGNEMIQYYFQQAKNFAITELQDNMKSQKDNYSMLNTFKEFETECLELWEKKQNNPGIFDLQKQNQDFIKTASEFFTQPIMYLDKKFQQKFDQTIKKFSEQSSQIFDQKYLEALLNFNNYLCELINLFKKKNIKINSSLIFNLEDEQINLENQQFLKKGAAQYLTEIFNQTWSNRKKIKIDNKIVVQLPECQLPIFQDINQQISDKCRLKLVSLFNNDDEINNIYKFLTEMLMIVQIKLDELQNNKQKDILQNQNLIKMNQDDFQGDFMIDFKIKFMGCREICPLCKRQCDQQHIDLFVSDVLNHKCSSGHQLQSFGGSYSQNDQQAITVSCDELTNDQIICYKGNEIKWINFKDKSIMKNWSFEVNKELQEQFKQKNIKLWNLLGSQICINYQQQGIPIQYQEKTLKKLVYIEKVHYILMLDDSGSMRGTPWKELMQAVMLFFEKLSDNPLIREKVKVSVIKHNYRSQVIFQNQTPSVNLVKQIWFEGGGNDFSKPLWLAYEICEETHQNFDKIILYFMSDGSCRFPYDAINQLSIFQRDKIHFYAVALGDFKTQVLYNMAYKFKNSKVTQAFDYEALRETFIKIVPNI